MAVPRRHTFDPLKLPDFKKVAPQTLAYLCLMDSAQETWRPLVSALTNNLTDDPNSEH